MHQILERQVVCIGCKERNEVWDIALKEGQQPQVVQKRIEPLNLNGVGQSTHTNTPVCVPRVAGDHSTATAEIDIPLTHSRYSNGKQSSVALDKKPKLLPEQDEQGRMFRC